MEHKRTVFILGAGASCPYGYPSGARLRELICRGSGFMKYYNDYLKNNPSLRGLKPEVSRFTEAFGKSHIKSIDLFMAQNPKLAPVGKYIIAFEILRLEKDSCFGEEAKWHQESREQYRLSERLEVRQHYEGTADFIGGDWYSYVYNRLIEGQVDRAALPDFSAGRLAFITFNYDRSLEQFFYESLRNSLTEPTEDRVVDSLRHLKILHAYGQIAPLKWQDPKAGVDYRPQQIDERFLQTAATNIKTIYEQKEDAELNEAKELLSQAEQIFLLGFGYAPENMNVLALPEAISPQCQVHGTAYGLIEEERKRVCASVHNPRKVDQRMTNIESDRVDCLTLLRKYF
jgi:hypothetical protein